MKVRNERFDIALGNPPYDAAKHLYMKFIYRTNNVSKMTVFVNPTNFLYSRTNKGIHKDIKNQLQNLSAQIEEIDANRYFDASFMGDNIIGICEFDNTKKGKICVKYLNGDVIEYKDPYNISKIDLNDPIISSICNKITNQTNKFGSLFDNNFVLLPNYTGFSCRDKIKKLRDDELFVFLPIKMDGDEYTYFPYKSNKRNSVMTVKDKETCGGLTVKSIEFGNGIIKFLKTDIARYCYYLGCKGFSNWKGLHLLPFMNFDDKVFTLPLKELNNKMYEVYGLKNNEIEKIQKTISDPYHIRD